MTNDIDILQNKNMSLSAWDYNKKKYDRGE